MQYLAQGYGGQLTSSASLAAVLFSAELASMPYDVSRILSPGVVSGVMHHRPAALLVEPCVLAI